MDITSPEQDPEWQYLQTRACDPEIRMDSFIVRWKGQKDYDGSVLLMRIAADLVTDKDWKGACVGHCDPPTMKADIDAIYDRSWAKAQGADFKAALYPEGPFWGQNVVFEDHPVGLGFVYNFLDEDDTRTPVDGEDPFWLLQARLEARVDHYLRWLAWLTRNKVAMARLTQQGYAPETDRWEVTEDLAMAYTHITSLQRVNKFLHDDAEMRTAVLNDPAVVAKYAEMQSTLSDFEAEVGISRPAGGATSIEDAFPMSKSWWAGKMPRWESATAEDQPDTVDIAKQFRKQAGEFRRMVGGRITAYLAQPDDN